MKQPRQARDISEILSREIWDLQDVCAYFGMKPGWVYGKIHSREIPHYKPGGGLYVRFKKSELLSWFDGTRRDTAA